MKLTKKQIRKSIFDILIYILGGSLYSIGINSFASPNNIAPGGLTGVGVIINHIFGFPIGVLIIVLNIPLFIIGLKELGKYFLIKTIIATVTMSVLIDVSAAFLPVYTGNTLLACLYGGLLTGAGLALVFMRGATTGGTDIIAKLINRKFKFLSIGRIILLMDLLIISASAIAFKCLVSALYAVIMIFASSRIIDSALYGADRGKMLFIITSKPEELSKAIMKKVSRGVTMLDGTGAYSNDIRYILMCAVRRHEAAKVHEIIKNIDNKAFIITTEAGEITGEGFKDLYTP